MYKILMFFLLMSPALAQAVICKTIDADGVVGYEELPAAECPQEVKLPEYSRYAPRPIAAPRASGGNVAARAARFAGYESIRIVQPEPGATVRDNQGQVAVSIALQPGLQQGHRISVAIDGVAVPGSFDGLAIQLTGVERGTHSLRAMVRDAKGDRLIESSSVAFTMRQTSLLENAGEQPEPPAAPSPGYPATDSSADFGPSGRADFSPPAGGIPSTPGRTNPSFAPKYTP